jgi:hypothetical protein
LKLFTTLTTNPTNPSESTVEVSIKVGAVHLQETKQTSQADRIADWYGNAGPKNPVEPTDTSEE